MQSGKAAEGSMVSAGEGNEAKLSKMPAGHHDLKKKKSTLSSKRKQDPF